MFCGKYFRLVVDVSVSPVTVQKFCTILKENLQQFESQMNGGGWQSYAVYKSWQDNQQGYLTGQFSVEQIVKANTHNL